MMRDRPYGAQLLAEARRLLAGIMANDAPSQPRFQALMIGKAMELAEKELNANLKLEAKLNDHLSRIIGTSSHPAQHPDLLSQQIRRGDFDKSDELYKFLRLVVAFKLRETNPSKVSEK